MAEKVRYYLEQSVPELEDLSKKGLFDKKEITMIMRRRTDFEHRIQGRGARPRDFLKYSEFESNLEKLRKKRYSRLSKVGLVETKPSISDWAGTRRVMFIFERATRKFPGDNVLWSEYLKFAKSNGAIKVIYKVYSRLLQLQPRNVDAWLSAAKYEFETNGNAKGARVLFQRALRFNKESLVLWLSYATFELSYISRLLARRKVLGLISRKDQEENMKEEEALFSKSIEDSSKDLDADADVIELPETTSAELKDQLNHLPEADIQVLGNPENNPALRGDVALAVFDLCIPAVLDSVPQYSTMINKTDKTFEIVDKFLSIIDKFEDLNRDYLYTHVVNHLQQSSENINKDIRTYLIDITLPIRGVNCDSANFSDALQLSVNKFIAYKVREVSSSNKEQLTQKYVQRLQVQFLQDEDHTPSEKTEALLKAIIKKCISQT